MQMQLDAQGLPKNGSMIPQGDDSKLVVVFYKRAEQNNFQSEQQGRPIFDDKDYIRIAAPGDRNSVVDRPVKEEDKERFPAQWLNYVRLGEIAHTGTPVDHWPRLTPSQVAEAKYSNIPTVESLAEMSDQAVSSMGMGWLGLRSEARAFLEKAKDASTAQRHAAENERLRADNERLETTIGELAKRIEALEGGTDKKAKKAA